MALNADVSFTWLGHGTFQFELASGQVILMDPWTDGNPAYPKGYEIRRVDTMCITHGHQDHIHDAVPLGLKFKPEIAAIYETCLWLNSKGVENTTKRSGHVKPSNGMPHCLRTVERPPSAPIR